MSRPVIFGLDPEIQENIRTSFILDFRFRGNDKRKNGNDNRKKMGNDKREKLGIAIEKNENDNREKSGMTQKKSGNDNTQKVCDNHPMGDILSALLTT